MKYDKKIKLKNISINHFSKCDIPNPYKPLNHSIFFTFPPTNANLLNIPYSYSYKPPTSSKNLNNNFCVYD